MEIYIIYILSFLSRAVQISASNSSHFFDVLQSRGTFNNRNKLKRQQRLFGQQYWQIFSHDKRFLIVYILYNFGTKNFGKHCFENIQITMVCVSEHALKLKRCNKKKVRGFQIFVWILIIFFTPFLFWKVWLKYIF